MDQILKKFKIHIANIDSDKGSTVQNDKTMVVKVTLIMLQVKLNAQIKEKIHLGTTLESMEFLLQFAKNIFFTNPWNIWGSSSKAD